MDSVIFTLVLALYPIPRNHESSRYGLASCVFQCNRTVHSDIQFSIYGLSGQPPQRPPSLGPNPALAGPFRAGPYPQYGLPPRNVLQGGYVPGVQPRAPSQQQPQNMLPSPSPGLYQQQQRQGSFPFNGLGHQAAGQQQHQTPSIQQHSNAHQANGASTGLPPHLTQNAATPSLAGTAPSASASEVGLDPNDFPALGSAPSNTASNGNSGAAASYASQAGTGVPPGTGGAVGGAVGGVGNGPQTRDFTPDDFPALGGQTQASSQSTDHSHPPGLNGFQQTEQSAQHRQNLLGSIQQPGTPGMLNIGAQARNVHPGFQQQTQTEAEKQRVSLLQSRLPCPATILRC